MQLHISAADIEQWTNNDPRRAQELLPKLIWKLVLSSCSQIRNHHFPFESGIQFNGYDGYLDADSVSKFVPNGKSIWEFGTNTNIKEKFEKDYSKRSFEQTGFDRTNATFCFVSSHLIHHDFFDVSLLSPFVSRYPLHHFSSSLLCLCRPKETQRELKILLDIR